MNQVIEGKTGVWSKVDFRIRYGVTMPVFEGWIKPIMNEVGWRVGERQKFPPAKTKIILDFLENGESGNRDRGIGERD